MVRLSYRYLLLGIVVVLTGLVLPMSRVLADDVCTIDYTTSSHGAAVIPEFSPYSVGTWEEGTGLVAGMAYDSDTRFAFNLPMSYEGVVGVIFHTNMDESDWLGSSVAVMSYDTTVTIGCWGTDTCGPDLPTTYQDTFTETGGYRHAYTTSIIDIASNLSVFFDWTYHNGMVLKSIDIIVAGECDDDGEPPLGTLTRPLTTADSHPQWEMYDPAYVHELDNTWPDDDGREPVYAYSDKLFASVHAVAAGTVTAVDYDITSQCETLDETGTPFAPHACYLVIPAVIRGEAISQLFTVQMTNTALVLVKDDEDENTIYTYFVSNPNVAKGDHLEPGCVLGQTMALNNSPISIGNIGIGGAIGNNGVSGSIETTVGVNTIQTGESVTVVRMDNLEPELTRLYPQLTAEPDEAACASDFDGCLNGGSSSLLSLNEWITSEGVSLLSGGGASLSGGSQIYQKNNMTLDDATTYTLTVQARATTAGNGFDVVNRIRLFAGEDSQEFGATTTWLTYSIDFAGEDLFSGDAYGVVNRNAADVGIEIRYICISGENATQSPNACYFKNHHFDDGPKDWTVDGGITFQSGQAFTYNDSTLEQIVQLYPLTGGDATYNLTIAGRLIATSAYTGQSGKYINLSYRFPMSGDYTLIDEVDSAMVGAEGKNIYSGVVDIEHTYVLTVPITISEYTTGLFSIKTNVTDADNYLTGFRIDYACLQSASTDDGSFPGLGGAGFDPPFYENCQVVAVPQDNNVSSWTYYHWSNLKRFFDCTLMVKLNSMAQLMDSAWKTSRLVFRWIIATGQMSGRWMSVQLFPWFNSQFANLVRGLGNTTSGTAVQFDSSANIITDALAAVQMIANAIRGIVTLIRTTIDQFLGFFHLITDLVGAIVGAYNDTQAIPIPYLPTCTLSPDENVFCIGIWVIDNTIFAGPGAAIIPIIITFASAHLLLWLAAEIKQVIMQQGQAI